MPSLRAWDGGSNDAATKLWHRHVSFPSMTNQLSDCDGLRLKYLVDRHDFPSILS